MTKLPTTFEYDGEEWREGQEVSLVVEFHGAPGRRVFGSLLAIRGREAFIDSQFGTLVGSASTLEDES